MQLKHILIKLREGTFFFFFWGGGGRGRAGASEGRVISESEHQKGRAIPPCELFKGRVTHLFQNFLLRIFVCYFSFFFNRLSFFISTSLIKFSVLL